MSKPIFVVRFPNSAHQESLTAAAKSLARNGVEDDYHVLVIKDEFTGGEIKFECYSSPHTEMEFKELQERVIALLNQNK